MDYKDNECREFKHAQKGNDDVDIISDDAVVAGFVAADKWPMWCYYRGYSHDG
jgi:hypothetical protein